MSGRNRPYDFDATCPSCQYDLSGHLAEAGEDAFRCPECGEATSRHQLKLQHMITPLRIGPVWLVLAITPAIALGLFICNLGWMYDSGMGGIILPILFGGPMLMLGLSIFATVDVKSIGEQIQAVIGLFIAQLVVNVLLCYTMVSVFEMIF